MKISCPKCNQDYDIDENTADGQGFTCTKCNSPFFFKKEIKKREQPKEEKKKTGLFECVDCGGMVSKMAYFCPHCGCPINVPKTSKEVFVRSFDISLWESIKIIIGFFIATIISVFIISVMVGIIGFGIKEGLR